MLRSALRAWLVCESCDVRVPATWCERAPDGAWLCRECAQKEHEASERDDYDAPIHVVEDWK